MNPYSMASDTGPLSYWGRVPVYATTWLVVVHCAFFALAALASPLGAGDFILGMVFSSQSLLESFTIWQLATYAFVPLPLSFWFLVEMAMLYFFGQEVEKYLGRRIFLTLYVWLVLGPSFILLVAGILGFSSILAGASAIHFGLFVAFAAIVPGAQLLFGLTAKWCAIGFLLFNSLLLLSAQAWSSLWALWIDVAVVIVFLRACGVHSLQWARVRDRGPVFRKVSPVENHSPTSEIGRVQPVRSSHKGGADPMGTIDPILEKISRRGLQSLTPAEKKRLEQARAQLLEQEKAKPRH